MFAADAVARMTGTIGVAAVTAGPGVTNTVTAVKNAQMAQSPLVLFGGATATLLKGRGALQDIDQLALDEAAREVGDDGARPCRRSGRPSSARSRSRPRACPGRCSSRCRSTCSIPRRSCAQWYEKEAGLGKAQGHRREGARALHQGPPLPAVPRAGAARRSHLPMKLPHAARRRRALDARGRGAARRRSGR